VEGGGAEKKGAQMGGRGMPPRKGSGTEYPKTGRKMGGGKWSQKQKFQKPSPNSYWKTKKEGYPEDEAKTVELERHP